MNYSLFIVEGTQDVELLARILKINGFTRQRVMSAVPELWIPFFPNVDLSKLEDITQRPRIPAPFQKEGCSILVLPAGGIDKIADEAVLVRTQLREGKALAGFGIIVDCDKNNGPVTSTYSALSAAFSFLQFPGAPGAIQGGTPRVGAYILPDNASIGAVEELLLEGAQSEFPTMLSAAENLIFSIQASYAPAKSLKELGSPFGDKKAVVGIIGAAFHPGRSIQVSIYEDNWVTPNTVTLPRMSGLCSFLQGVAGY